MSSEYVIDPAASQFATSNARLDISVAPGRVLICIEENGSINGVYFESPETIDHIVELLVAARNEVFVSRGRS